MSEEMVTVRARMAFTHPIGSWMSGEIRDVKLDDQIINLVDGGYLDPVWDAAIEVSWDGEV